MNRPAGLHLFDHAEYLFSAASGPDLLPQGFEFFEVDGLTARVGRMPNHPCEITDVYVSLFHVSYRREHSPVFVRQSGFQSGDSVSKT